MVALIVSLAVTMAMVAIIVRVARRRAPGTPLTWGEAFLAATFVFTLLFMAYGVVPHQFLALADNELKWRSDSYGIPTGPLPFKNNRLFEDGIAFGGRGRIIITAQVVRDIIAATIYIVALGAQLYAWKWWQSRGRKAAAQPELVSAYGRPILKKV